MTQSARFAQPLQWLAAILTATPNLFGTLARLAKSEKYLQEVQTRVESIQLAVVTAIDEPSRQIRVSREQQGLQSQSYWIRAGRRSAFEDEPMPPIGTTVLVAFVEGNPHDGYLLRTIANATNPGDRRQRNPKLDSTEEVPGDERRSVTGKVFHYGASTWNLEVEQELNIVSNGSSIKVVASEGGIEIAAIAPDSGTIVLKAFESIKLLDGEGGSVLLSGGKLAIAGVTDATINGKGIVLVGSKDTDGNTNFETNI